MNTIIKKLKLNKDLLLPFTLFLLCWLSLLWYFELEFFSTIYCDKIDGTTDESFSFTYTNETDSNKSNKPLYEDSHNNNCFSIMDKYKNIGKRKIYWFTCEKGKGNYTNYTEFKKSWDPNTDILLAMKNQLKSEIINEAHKFNVAKRSFSWFFKGSKPGGGRGL